jgi:DnaJ-class molecular chaperone
MGKPILQTCGKCGGSGYQTVKRQQVIKGKSETVEVQEDCVPCDGNGKIVLGEEPEPGSRR